MVLEVRCPKPREGSSSPAASELPSGNSFLATAPPYLCSDLSWFSASVGGLGDKADRSHWWWDPGGDGPCGFPAAYLTSALRCLTQILPWVGTQPSISLTTLAVGGMEARQALGMDASPSPGCARGIWSSDRALETTGGFACCRLLALWSKPPWAQCARSASYHCCQLCVELQDGSGSGKKSHFLFTEPACLESVSQQGSSAPLHRKLEWNWELLAPVSFGICLWLASFSPTSSGWHEFTPYCNEKTTQQGLGFFFWGTEFKRKDGHQLTRTQNWLVFTSFSSECWGLIFPLPSNLENGVSLRKKIEMLLVVILNERLVKCYRGEGWWLMSLTVTPQAARYWAPQMCQHGVRQWWAETLEVLPQDFLKQLNEIYNSHTTQFTHLQCTVHGS